jgi:hypothetical protein
MLSVSVLASGRGARDDFRGVLRGAAAAPPLLDPAPASAAAASAGSSSSTGTAHNANAASCVQQRWRQPACARSVCAKTPVTKYSVVNTTFRCLMKDTNCDPTDTQRSISPSTATHLLNMGSEGSLDEYRHVVDALVQLVRIRWQDVGHEFFQTCVRLVAKFDDLRVTCPSRLFHADNGARKTYTVMTYVYHTLVRMFVAERTFRSGAVIFPTTCKNALR